MFLDYEKENCQRVLELKSKWRPQLGMAEARNVTQLTTVSCHTQLVMWKVISAMNTSVHHQFKSGYLLNCLIIISTETLCHNISVNKDSAMLYTDPSLKKIKVKTLLERGAANESNIFKMRTMATEMRLLKLRGFFVGTSGIFISMLF